MTENGIAEKRQKRRLVIVVVAVGLVVLAAGWWALQRFGPYSSLRREARSIGIDRLSSWAVSVLDNPPTESGTGPEGALRRADIPADIRPLARGFVLYEPGDPESGQGAHILFACGGGFYHYGLRVGRPGYEPRPDSRFHFEKLRDGVWGMYER